QPIAPLPIDLAYELSAGLGQYRTGCGDVDHLVRGGTLDGVDDRSRPTGGKEQHAGIARLATAHWVEHRAVEPDAPRVGLDHPGAARPQIPVVAKQELGHRVNRPA